MDQYNTEIFSCFHLHLPYFSPLVVRHLGTTMEMFWRLSLILQNWTVPSSPLKFLALNQFLRHRITEIEHSLGSTSIQVLSQKVWFLWEDWQVLCFYKFALVFDRHAKSLVSNFNSYSWNWTSEVSCSLLLKFVTNLMESMRNSDLRLSIVFVRHEILSDFTNMMECFILSAG